MGIYLNSRAAYTLYKSETEKPYFVDKTSMLEELFPLVRTGNNHICITRPRRFGKTVTANMIASFFSRAVDAQDIFQSLSIADAEDYGKYRNQFSVIHISFNELGGMCSSYEEYVGKIERRLVRDLKNEYPEMEIEENADAADVLLELYAATSQELKTKEEILSAMVVYGFLSYENGEVSIPNKEVGELLVGIGYDKKDEKVQI